MDDKKLGRREFLKLAVATAAAAGLSHFRVLNFGGAGVAHAGSCAGDIENPDWCKPLIGFTDECVPPTDPDECQPMFNDPDLCSGQPGDPDYACWPFVTPDTCTSLADQDLCDPGQEPDECQPPDDVDSCSLGYPNDVDQCGAPGDTDYGCTEAGGDTCSTTDADLCNPWSAGTDTDECGALGDTDYACPQLSDVCGAADPDLCEPAWEPDECLPAVEDADLPSAVEMVSLTARAGASPLARVLSVLGGLAAALVALRRRGRAADQTEEVSE